MRLLSFYCVIITGDTECKHTTVQRSAIEGVLCAREVRLGCDRRVVSAKTMYSVCLVQKVDHLFSSYLIDFLLSEVISMKRFCARHIFFTVHDIGKPELLSL